MKLVVDKSGCYSFPQRPPSFLQGILRNFQDSGDFPENGHKTREN